MRSVIIPLGTLLLCLGCRTRYGTQGFTGGYSDSQLGENVFRVTFKGNAYTSPERTSDFALLRCAEIALQHGFRYFAIIEASDYTKETTYTTPTNSYTTGSATAYGSTVYGQARTTTYGGHTYHFSKPRTTNTILCFREKPDAQALVFDAEFLSQSLRAQYGIP